MTLHHLSKSVVVPVAAAVLLLLAACSSTETGGDARRADQAKESVSAPQSESSEQSEPSEVPAVPEADDGPCFIVKEGITLPITARVGVDCATATQVATAVKHRDPSQRPATNAAGDYVFEIDGWSCVEFTGPTPPPTACTSGESSFLIANP